MRYVTHPNTDITSSRIALGTDRLGSHLDKRQSQAVLDEFCFLGGNLIDTAAVYGDWDVDEKSVSEKTIGVWMMEKKNRSELVISTKGGHHDLLTGKSRLSREEIISDINSSLKNLGTDYVDFYFLHRDDKTLEVPYIIDTLLEILKDGKARAVGLSNWSAERFEEADSYCRSCGAALAASQIQFGLACPNISLIDPTLDIMKKAEFEYYSKKNVSLFAYSSQSKGYFSKLYHNMPLSEKAETRYKNEKSEKVYNMLLEICHETNVDIASVVVSVLLNNPAFCTIPIVGCKNAEQIRTSLMGADLKIGTKTVLEVINAGLYSA